METTHKTVAMMIVFLAATSVSAMKNPAAVYCTSLGYEYMTEVNQTSGGTIGLCRTPAETLDAWKFIQGEEGQDRGYCARKGYNQEVTDNWSICGETLYTRRCAVCILEDGRKTEVTKLMGLNFHETECGDDRCGLPENYRNCPKDCPSGGADEICDMVSDGVCDSDCRNNEDPDCKKSTCWPMTLWLVSLATAWFAKILKTY